MSPRRDNSALGIGSSRIWIKNLHLLKCRLGQDLDTPWEARRRAQGSKSELELWPTLRPGRRFCGRKMDPFFGIKIRPQIQAQSRNSKGYRKIGVILSPENELIFWPHFWTPGRRKSNSAARFWANFKRLKAICRLSRCGNSESALRAPPAM